MNLPELLGTNSPFGRALVPQGGTGPKNADDGGAFQSSIDSAVGDSQRSANDASTQNPQEGSVADAMTDGSGAPLATTDAEATDPLASAALAAQSGNPSQPPTRLTFEGEANGRIKPQGESVRSEQPFKNVVSSPENVRSAVVVNPGSDQMIDSEGSPEADAVQPIRTKPNARPSVSPVATVPQATPEGTATRVAQSEPATAIATAPRQSGETTPPQAPARVRLNTEQSSTNRSDLMNGQPDRPNDQRLSAPSEAQTLDARDAGDARQDERLFERRSEMRAADATRADRSIQVQNTMQDGAQPIRSLSGAPTQGVEFGQTTASTQATLVTAQTTLARDVVMDRISVPHATPATSVDGPARHTIAQIAAAIRNQPLIQTVELSLDPPELGRIEIQMDLGETGLKATLSAERSTTGDLIRRQAELLQQQLAEAGFSDVDLDFRDFQSGDDKQNTDEGSQMRRDARESETSTAAKPQHSQIAMRLTASGMDVRL